MAELELEWPEAWSEPVIYHPVQEKMLTDNVRFKVVPAGRRSGKTFHARRNLVLEAMRVPGHYFLAAPVRDQAKRIFWSSTGALLPTWFQSKAPSLSDLIYYLKNGSEIHVIGLDKPARIEGQPWQGGVIDELANCKPETWSDHVRPIFDTLGMQNTFCWLVGVPEGLNFYYDMYQYAITAHDPEWAGYTWKSSDILPAKVIDAAKRQLSPKQFKQEYEASFETFSGRVYDDYDLHNHTDAIFDPALGHIIWTHDFNFTPLSSAILQRKGDDLYIVDEIVLTSAVASQTAVEFCDRYKDHKHCLVTIYGDSSGKIGEKHGHKSDYTNIESILKQNGFRVKMKVPKANPAIKDGQNSLRAKILNSMSDRSLFVNPAKCKTCDKGLYTVQLKQGSTFQEEDSEYQHITTALRYFTAVEFPVAKRTATQSKLSGL